MASFWERFKFKDPAAPAVAGQPPPPPPPSGADEPDIAEQEAKRLKSLKFDKTTSREFAGIFVEMEKTFYGVLGRVFEDERWNLQPPEIEQQEHIITVGLMIYGDRLKDIVIPIGLGFGLAAPAIARLLFMPPKDESNMGAPPNNPGPERPGMDEKQPVRAVK